MLPLTHGKLVQAKERDRARRKLEAMLAEAQRLLEDHQHKCATLGHHLSAEKADLDRLDGLSLVALFYTVLGTKEERLEKERQEYLAAKLKHDEAVAAVGRMQAEVDRLLREVGDLRDAKAEYERLVEEKHRLLVEARDPRTEALLGFTERLADLGADRKELQEAIQAGEAAQNALERVQVELRAAENWGTWDMLGGGLLATMAKHSRIDTAKQHAQDAQWLLHEFQEELADAGQGLTVALDIGGFSTFADYFFDGLIADWVVQSKIRNASAACSTALSKVGDAVAACRQRLAEIDRETAAVAEHRRQAVEQE